jgi:hypothetical protein
MKKIVYLLLVLIFCCHAAYAMDLDGIKGHFLRGEWKDGIREGEALLANAKRDSADLDQLYYYLALCYMKDRNFLRTSDICEIILKEFPSSKFVPQAHYVLIDAYAGSDNVVAARASAESFLKKYPGTAHAGEVEARLRQLKERRASAAAVSEPDIVLAADLMQSGAEAAVPASFWIQVGAFSSEKNADNLAVKLRGASYTAAVSPSVSQGKAIYKVRVGPYGGREEAQGVSKRLSRQGYPTKVIP